MLPIFANLPPNFQLIFSNLFLETRRTRMDMQWCASHRRHVPPQGVGVWAGPCSFHVIWRYDALWGSDRRPDEFQGRSLPQLSDGVRLRASRLAALHLRCLQANKTRLHFVRRSSSPTPIDRTWEFSARTSNAAAASLAAQPSPISTSSPSTISIAAFCLSWCSFAKFCIAAIRFDNGSYRQVTRSVVDTKYWTRNTALAVHSAPASLPCCISNPLRSRYRPLHLSAPDIAFPLFRRAATFIPTIATPRSLPLRRQVVPSTANLR